MKKRFSNLWKSSCQPRKQRKYRYNAPLHIRKKFMSVHLSGELTKRYKKRNIPVRKDDIVKILRGQFKKMTGKVTRVDLKKLKVYVEKVENVRRDGTKSYYPLEPSNLEIIELNTNDNKRVKVLERNINYGKETSKKA